MELHHTYTPYSLSDSLETAPTSANLLPILLIYDDEVAGIAAREAVDGIARNLDAIPQYATWREDQLEDLTVQDTLRRDLEAAKMVVLASSHSSTLSSPLRNWLVASRFSFNPSNTALLILRQGSLEIHCSGDRLKSETAALIADSPGVKVFCHPFSAPRRRRVYWAPPREASPGERRYPSERLHRSDWATL